MVEVSNLFQPQLLYNFAGGVCVILVGFLVSKFLSRAIKSFLRSSGVDMILEKYKFREAVFNIDVIEVIGIILFLYVLGIFIYAGLYIIGFKAFYEYMGRLIFEWAPNVIYGIILIMGSLWIAYLVRERVRESVLIFGDILGEFIYYIVAYILIVSILPKFGIDNTLFVDLFRYFMMGISFGIGLAIGIGLGLVFKKYFEDALKKYL